MVAWNAAMKTDGIFETLHWISPSAGYTVPDSGSCLCLNKFNQQVNFGHKPGNLPHLECHRRNWSTNQK